MVKKLASKRTKKLLTEAAIKEQKLEMSEFTSSWQGRVFIADVERSEIAQKLGVVEKGEYAIKVR